MKLEDVLHQCRANRFDAAFKLEMCTAMEEVIIEAIKTRDESDNLRERLDYYAGIDRNLLERCLNAPPGVKPNTPPRKIELPWFCDPLKGGLNDSRKSTD